MRISSCYRALAVFLCLSAGVHSAAAAVGAGIEAEYLMFSDPVLTVPDPVRVIDPALAPLWMQALQRPESDMQRMAAETIARGHQQGVPELQQAVPGLEAILQSEASHPAARFAAARALIVLDARDSADKLFAVSQKSGADLWQLIEPALAEWGHAAAAAVWMERLSAADTRPRDLIVAVRGLGQVGEQSALSALVSLADDPTRTPNLRLEAAAAAGQIAQSGLEQDAERFASGPASPLFVNQLCALRLLARHTDEAATALLSRLAGHDEPSVAAAALRRLNEIDVNLTLPMSLAATRNSDPEVRRQGAIAMLQVPAVDHIEPLSRLLADPHPDLRRSVCAGLHQLAQTEELNHPVRDSAMEILAAERWQGHEQAALLLGALEHQPAAPRLVELLESPRLEARVASAWGLRRVAVPDTIPALLDRAERETNRRRADARYEPGLDEQVAHLFEALGVLQAQEATELLESYIPKDVGGNRLSRGAAVWALGRIHEGNRNTELETKLHDRIEDFQPRPTERSIVKEMAAVSLARMQAKDLAPDLRDLATSSEESLSVRLRLALGWAVRELTGEELPPPEPALLPRDRWFLMPLSP